MTVHIQSAMELTQVSGVKVLTFGDAGAGKTHLIATAPTPIILSAESGLLTLRKTMKESGIDLPVIVINTIQDLNNALTYFKTDPNAKQFQTICLDSISEIAEVVLKNEKANSKDGRKAYGEMNDIMTTVIREFRDLQGFHVYFSAKKVYDKDDTTGAMVHMPSMPGRKLSADLPFYFDEVFYLTMVNDPNGQPQRVLQTVKDLQVTCVKDRSGCLDYYELPNLTNIINKIIQL